MKKRLLFHFLNFFFLAISLLVAGVIYTQLSPDFKGPLADTMTDFFTLRWPNLILIAGLAYFLIYLTGMVKYTVEDKYFRMVTYLRELFKLILILGMVSFVEFFMFFETKVGRQVYFYMLAIYSIYYLSYLVIRSHKGPRKLLWLARASVFDIQQKYISEKGFNVIRGDEAGAVMLDPEVHVVYQDGSITEGTSETLIKNKLVGNTVIELVELIEKESGKIPVDYVNIHWFLEKFDVADRNFFRINRFFNIIMSMLLTLILFPPGLLIALIHKILSHGPIFFVQQRQGLHGKTFNLIKFRTMVKEAEKNGAQFSGRDDPRITKLGKVMRRLRLDEIPQLINVLKGDMSLVGPRPEREVFIDHLSETLSYYKLRLLVPPGLTGWAQINGVYAGSNINDHKEKLEYDLYYIKNRTIFMDMLILLRTIRTILMAQGE